MLSKNQVKLISSLKKKKYRQQYRLFIAEGIKVVEELLKSNYKLNKLYHTIDYHHSVSVDMSQLISEKELGAISEFNSPNKVLALFEIPESEKIKIKGLALVLDEINDPGNLGTIIRLADWFGIDQIICSLNTVDCYNQKVVQASMGSLSRTSIVYCDVDSFLKKEKRIIYGAMLEGENVYQSILEKEAVLIMGNEANGISKPIQALISKKLNIPQFGEIKKTESLNVAASTAILLSEFKRNFTN
jgi:TrmH family RNA methyltransferase